MGTIIHYSIAYVLVGLHIALIVGVRIPKIYKHYRTLQALAAVTLLWPFVLIVMAYKFFTEFIWSGIVLCHAALYVERDRPNQDAYEEI